MVTGELQSSMGQEMLSMAALMSIEYELLHSLDFTNTIKECVLLMLEKQQ